MKKILAFICVAVALLSYSLPSFAGGGVVAGTGRGVQQTCGITYLPQQGIHVLLVDYPQANGMTHCTLALQKAKKSQHHSQKGVIPGYQEQSDLILEVKGQGVSEILSEYHFSTNGDPSGAVVYVGQALSKSAKKLGYSDEIRRTLKTESKRNTTLYAGEAVVSQTLPDGKIQKRKRLDIVWGSAALSVGASIWCLPEKARNCDFQQDAMKIFESMETISSE